MYAASGTLETMGGGNWDVLATRGGIRSLGPSKMEVAAGAKIRQRVYPDPENLSFWQEQPAGILYVNYVDERTAQEILRHKPRDLTAGGEGFLSNLQVGDIPQGGDFH